MTRFALALIAALALAGCQEKPELTVTDVVVRLPATPRAPAAAYFIVHGGPVGERLMDVTAQNAIRSELHESMKSGGMASMKPIESGVEIPAKGVVKFEPGGKHVMLFDVNPALKPPRTMAMEFTFASGERIEADATLKHVGDQ